MKIQTDVDLYEVLGVPNYAHADEIRAKYKKLALKYHPDKNGEESTEHFQKIQAAYEILGDKRKRSDYDTKVGTFSRDKADRSTRRSAQRPKKQREEPEPQKPSAHGPQPGGKEWYYYQSFTKRQWTGPTGGTQNFHHFGKHRSPRPC